MRVCKHTCNILDLSVSLLWQIIVKIKDDLCSKFSNLSNWKEET